MITKEQLTAWMIENRLKKRDVIEKTGISRTALYNFLTGRSKGDAFTLGKLEHLINSKAGAD